MANNSLFASWLAKSESLAISSPINFEKFWKHLDTCMTLKVNGLYIMTKQLGHMLWHYFENAENAKAGCSNTNHPTNNRISQKQISALMHIWKSYAWIYRICHISVPVNGILAHSTVILLLYIISWTLNFPTYIYVDLELVLTSEPWYHDLWNTMVSSAFIFDLFKCLSVYYSGIWIVFQAPLMAQGLCIAGSFIMRILSYWLLHFQLDISGGWIEVVIC